MTRSKAVKITGTVRSVADNAVRVSLPRASVGDLCWLITRNGKRIPSIVTGFIDRTFTLAPLERESGLYPGSKVETWGEAPTVRVGEELLGHAVNALGIPLDKHSLAFGMELRELTAVPPSPNDRPVECEQIGTGVGAIDGLLTLGAGQRIGIFAGAGTGKSTLLAMMTAASSVDVVVAALVGERGREVGEFLEMTIGRVRSNRCVAVVATSDEASAMRQLAPATAMTIAEYFRDQGKSVLLVIDSLTRFARALRETSLAAGELPVRHGYPASVFSALPCLTERAGATRTGSITAIYTVLTNEHGDIDPLAEEVKSLIDGHIVLNPELHALGILPAIDIAASVSRMFERLHDDRYLHSARAVRRAITRLTKERDILLLGGEPDAELRRILDNDEEILDLVRQIRSEQRSIGDTKDSVIRMATKLSAASSAPYRTTSNPAGTLSPSM